MRLSHLPNVRSGRSLGFKPFTLLVRVVCLGVRFARERSFSLEHVGICWLLGFEALANLVCVRLTVHACFVYGAVALKPASYIKVYRSGCIP